MHNRITTILLISAATAVATLSSCGDKQEGSAFATLLAERDSLSNIAKNNEQQIADMNVFFDSISACIDSIAKEEEMLYVTVNPETGRRYSRHEMQERVAQFKEILSRQRRRIADLSSRLNKDKNLGDVSKLNSIIDYLNSQLDAKDAQMSKLQAELASSRRQVGELISSVNSLKENVSALENDKKSMGTVLTAQSDMINECYVKIASKKELERAGILTGGGFLKKKKVNYSAFSPATFQRVDIRHFTQVNINGKKPKLLTAVPAGSYSLRKAGDGQWLLSISDPTAFWSVSNYLVIQTD